MTLNWRLAPIRTDHRLIEDYIPTEAISAEAIGNLGEAAGSIRMPVEVQKLDGSDRTWLPNAVLEPLDEANMEVEEGR